MSAPLNFGVNRQSSGEMKNSNHPSSSQIKFSGSMSGLSVPSPKSSPHIVDDIRNDNELMFADDISQAAEVTPPQQSATVAPETRLHQPPSHRRGSSSVPASRRSSQKEAIADLQREVDMALEFFSQEADNCGDDAYMSNEVQYLPIHKGGGVRFNVSGSSGDCDDSYPSTAATSLSPSDDFDNDTDNSQAQQIPSQQYPSSPVKVGLSLKHRTKSLISLPLSLLPSQTTVNCAEEMDYSNNFDSVICEELQLLGITPEQHAERSFAVDFEANHSLRNAMEPFLCVARECHSATCNVTIS